MRVGMLVVLLVCAACSGGRHRRGDQQAIFSASFDEPISGRSLGFDGHGDARNAGVAAAGQWFLRDRWALGVRTGYRYYDGGTHALELEATARHYLFEAGPVGFLFEVTGGGSFASDEVPPGGTPVNWIWGFGLTFEVPLADTTDLLLGYQWRHLSNGRGGSAPDNPTQNDHRVWVGVALDW